MTLLLSQHSDQHSDQPKNALFDEDILYSKIERLSPYERLNFLRSEFDLGRHPNSKGTVDFRSEKEILDSFDPQKVKNITQ